MKIDAYCVKETLVATLALLVIAIMAILILQDPENIVVNIIVAISAFITGDRHRKSVENKYQGDRGSVE